MKLSTKIFLSFMSFVVLIFILGGTGIYYLTTNNKNNEDIALSHELVSAYDNVAFQTVRANAAIRGYMFYEEDYMKENHYEIRETLHGAIDKVQSIDTDSEDFQAFLTQLTEWEAGIDEQIVPLIESGNTDELMEVSKPILGEGSTNLVVFAKGMSDANNENIEKEFDAMLSTGKFVMWMVITISIIGVIASILLSVIFGRNLRQSIALIIEKINIFADGDFNVRLDIDSKDELGDLADSFNTMTQKLKQTMHRVSNSSAQVAAMSEEFSASSAQVSEVTHDITHSIVEISDGMENQSDMTNNLNDLVTEVLNESKEMLENVQSMRNRVDDTDSTSAAGLHEVQSVSDQMSVILDNSEQINSEIHELNSLADTITNSIHYIKDIADQTNLLALNASIEAARAGENGKGFAVVADEVRKLAEVSNEVSVSIEEVIQSVTEKIQHTVRALEQNNQSVKEGQASVVANGEMFDQILQSIGTVKSETNDVEGSIQTIFEKIGELVVRIQQINDISTSATNESQTIAAAAEEQNATMLEVADASAELANLATELQSLTQDYKF